MPIILKVNWDILSPASMSGETEFLSIEEAQRHAEAAWNCNIETPLVWEKEQTWLEATTSDGDVELFIHEFADDLF